MAGTQRSMGNPAPELDSKCKYCVIWTKEVLKAKFNLKSSKFVWLIRHISPLQAKEVQKLGLAGVYVAKDQKRFYPQGALIRHIVGYVDIDNEGVTGVEKVFNDFLNKN